MNTLCDFIHTSPKNLLNYHFPNIIKGIKENEALLIPKEKPQSRRKSKFFIEKSGFIDKFKKKTEEIKDAGKFKI